MKNSGKKRVTLRGQITIMVIGIVVFTVGLIFLLDTGFIEDFYLSRKEKTLQNVFNTIETAASEGNLYRNSYLSEIENIRSRENIALMVMRSDGRVRISSESNNQRMVEHLFSIAFYDKGQTVSSSDNYMLLMYKDEAQIGDFLVLWGSLSDGNTIFMETAMEPIRDSIQLMNRFILIAGLTSIIIGVIVAAILTARLLSPLKRLTEISERMSMLDFDVKYEPKDKLNEIDLLGIRMNDMSSLIEQNIKDLKQANVELKADIRLKEKNEEMRREFISNVSHELKTPISLILGYADGLLDSGISDSVEKRNHYAEVISDEASRMDAMIAKLLELNELEYGKQQIQMSRCDLAEIVKEEVYSVKLLAENADVKIENTLSGHIYIWADELLVRQVVENYLTNAIRYVAGERIITCSMEALENSVKFVVFNTGDGIPEEEIERIWDKFYKVDRARTRELNSTGIGLSIVKAAAEAMGCDLGARNVKDGVEFYFTFDSKVS